jgi:hypothetical protein
MTIEHRNQMRFVSSKLTFSFAKPCPHEFVKLTHERLLVRFGLRTFLVADEVSRCAIDGNHCFGPWKGSAPKVRRGVHIPKSTPTCTGVFGFLPRKSLSYPRKLARADFRLGSTAPFWKSVSHFRSAPMSRHCACLSACFAICSRAARKPVRDRSTIRMRYARSSRFNCTGGLTGLVGV